MVMMVKVLVAEADLGLLQNPRWSFQPLTVITKRSVLDVATVLDQPLSGVAIFSVWESGLLLGVILEIYHLICEIAAKICDCFTAFISFNLLVWTAWPLHEKYANKDHIFPYLDQIRTVLVRIYIRIIYIEDSISVILH